MVGRKLKPLARSLSAPALVRRGRIVISRSLEEELFRSAEILSEGTCRVGPNGRDIYFGSTMITFELDRLRRYWRGRFDAAARRRFAEAAQGSVRFHLRAMRIAYAEVARRVSARPLGTAQVETRVHLSGTHLHLDVDLEVPLGVSSISRDR